ncbi:MAG: Na+/H+ antiporter subunit D [Chlorobiaceae bacterium]|nr:Na+/H+ antiporter subunit D [Chlorobiaceae bacterium]MBA4310215.1 Na+/H+ antiporter subunit D [Chlorobiaceae bacterium]
MNLILVLPILIPFTTAILCLFFWKNIKAQRIFHLSGAFLYLIFSFVLFSEVRTNGILVTQVGDWVAPFGITFVGDLFSAIMILINGIIGFATAIYAVGSIDEKRAQYGFYPLLQFLIMGISGAFLTGDIFNLYVWFEVMLMSSFVLIALGGTKPQIEGAIKYVTLNLLSSAFFLTGCGILYGVAGTLNLADLSIKLAELNNPGLVTVIGMLFLVSFGIKAGIFPLFFWLPASYHTPPAAVSAIFGGMMTKVGVYSLIRVYTLLFNHDIGYTHTIILVLASFTMVTGVLGAFAQTEFRRILSFHIVSQIGYMILGLAIFTPLSIAGTIFYIAHNIFAKTNLFFISGVVRSISGSYSLKKLGGLYKPYPMLGILFLISAFALAGIPPLSGFWAKFIVIKAALEVEDLISVAVALFVSLLTLLSMIKIWNDAFWKDKIDSESEEEVNQFKSMSKVKKIFFLSPIVLLALITISIGFFPEFLFSLSRDAAEQLLNPQIYIEAVLGKVK